MLHIMCPNFPADSLEHFLKEIDGITIYQVIKGNTVEAFIDFIFQNRKFTAHLNVDQWIFTANEDGITDVEFAGIVNYQ